MHQEKIKICQRKLEMETKSNCHINIYWYNYIHYSNEIYPITMEKCKCHGKTTKEYNEYMKLYSKKVCSLIEWVCGILPKTSYTSM